MAAAEILPMHSWQRAVAGAVTRCPCLFCEQIQAIQLIGAATDDAGT
jgi:hypothetical protein